MRCATARRHRIPRHDLWTRTAESILAFAAARAFLSRRAVSTFDRRDDDLDDADAPVRLISRLFVRWDPSNMMMLLTFNRVFRLFPTTYRYVPDL